MIAISLRNPTNLTRLKEKWMEKFFPKIRCLRAGGGGEDEWRQRIHIQWLTDVCTRMGWAASNGRHSEGQARQQTNELNVECEEQRRTAKVGFGIEERVFHDIHRNKCDLIFIIFKTDLWCAFRCSTNINSSFLLILAI